MKTFILHGWTYDTDKWGKFLKLLEDGKLNPELLKIPGLTQKIDKPWTIDDFVIWLTDETKSEERINLIGHSNGGRIAMNFALKYPDKIKNLILIDSAGIYHNDLSIILKRKIFKIIAKAGKKIINNPSAKRLLYRVVGEVDYERADKKMKETMMNLIESDKKLNPEMIKNKTLIIWGEKDKTTPLSDGKVLNRKIVNSKLHIINSTKHSPQFAHPKEVAEIILNEL